MMCRAVFWFCELFWFGFFFFSSILVALFHTREKEDDGNFCARLYFPGKLISEC